MRSPIDRHTALEELGLRGLAALLTAHDVDRAMSLGACVDLLIDAERAERARRGLERRTKRSRLGDFKPIAHFDWTFPKTINKPKLQALLNLDFVRTGENVILVGPHGTGKTMLAKNLAHAAVLAGHSAHFTTVARLLNDVGAAETPRRRELRLRAYTNLDLLVTDELGYLAYDAAAADLFFELVNRRHEAKKSLVVTTNLAFKDWNTVFPQAACTVALVDRLTHRAHICKIDGPSWRRKEALEREGSVP